MSGISGSSDFADDIVPPIEPAPTVTREFLPESWHRPRKQFIRKYQWNHEIVAQVIRTNTESDSTIRVFGIPSSEYLDLLSMRSFCEEHNYKVLYLGYNSSYPQQTSDSSTDVQGVGRVDLYKELQTERMIDASSFVHPSSFLVPDQFEQIRNTNTMSRKALNQFENFDVINLDICGCIIRPQEDRAHDAIEAVSELIRWQSTRRLRPWLFFVTTFACPEEINLTACAPLIQAVKSNADDSDEFRDQLKAKTNFDADTLLSLFTTPDVTMPPQNEFIRIFALSFGKWLASRLTHPTPRSFVSMLPSYCFRHENRADPELLSLAYLIEPAPSPGPQGVSPAAPVQDDGSEKYRSRAKQILTKSFGIDDLDAIMSSNDDKRKEMADETEQLLIDCGFESNAVQEFVQKYR